MTTRSVIAERVIPSLPALSLPGLSSPALALQMLALLGMAHGSTACGGPATARAQPTQAEDAPARVMLIRLEPRQPFFVAGETMSFELSYGGILTGRAVLAVGEPGEIDGRTILIVRSQLETAGAAKLLTVVRDTVDTQIDWHTGVPIEHRGQAQGSKRAVAHIRFDGRRTAFAFQREGSDKKEHEVTLPPGEIMHDIHSMLGALRAWDPEPGAQVYFYSVSGQRVWRTDLTFRGSETVRTAMGLRAALHFAGSSARLDHRSLDVDTSRSPRSVAMWFSDDAQRMPLRIVAGTEVGDFQAELVSYQGAGAHVSRN